MNPPTVRASQMLYLASTQDKSVVGYEIDEGTGALQRRFRLELPGNPGPMAFSPGQTFVYVAMTGWNGKRGDDGAAVASLRRAPDGRLSLVGTAALPTRAPYIQVDPSGTCLLAAHYGNGAVTVQRIREGVCTDEVLEHRNTQRTAHCIELDPSGRYVFVPHTAPNRVYQFVLDPDAGTLKSNDPAYVEGPEEGHDFHAPRHYAHHPRRNQGFTSNEFGGGITAWDFDPDRGTLTRTQTISTLPPDYEGTSAAADIKLTPDGRFAYVSNRDTTAGRPEGEHRDTLAVIALDDQGGPMQIVQHVRTVHFPRACGIDTTGNFLFAAGQKADALRVYRIDRETGKLTMLADYETGGAPIWVMCAPVK